MAKIQLNGRNFKIVQKLTIKQLLRSINSMKTELPLSLMGVFCLNQSLKKLFEKQR